MHNAARAAQTINARTFKNMEHTMTSKLHDKGLAMRKQVLGAAHVEKTLAGVDQYTQPLQEIVNEYVWGAVWAPPGLKPRDRSMITISMLPALNRPQELKTHIR